MDATTLLLEINSAALNWSTGCVQSTPAGFANKTQACLQSDDIRCGFLPWTDLLLSEHYFYGLWLPDWTSCIQALCEVGLLPAARICWLRDSITGCGGIDGTLNPPLLVTMIRVAFSTAHLNIPEHYLALEILWLSYRHWLNLDSLLTGSWFKLPRTFSTQGGTLQHLARLARAICTASVQTRIIKCSCSMPDMFWRAPQAVQNNFKLQVFLGIAVTVAS